MTLNEQSSYFQSELNKNALDFLEARSIPHETTLEFGVGYCPVKCPQEVRQFASRIVIPLYDLQGDVIGFGGRLVGQEDAVKWINSYESSIYKKGRYLYNLNNAQDYILKEGSVILVEGYFDCIRLWINGFRNVVASCGTSLTVWQIRAMKRYADSVSILYDGDKSGQAAGLRAMEICKEERFQAKMVNLPDELDPDDYVLGWGSLSLRRLLND